MSLISTSVRRPIGVCFFASTVCILGAVGMARLPVDLLPEGDFPRINVVTRY